MAAKRYISLDPNFMIRSYIKAIKWGNWVLCTKTKNVLFSKSNNSFDEYHDMLLLHLPVFSLSDLLFVKESGFCILHSLGSVRIKMAVFKIA